MQFQAAIFHVKRELKIMTRETIAQLTTGDFVIDTETNHTYMITAVSPSIDSILTIDSLMSNPEKWDKGMSRLYTSPEKLKQLEEFHKKIKEMTENRR
jgi:hypothetical protein